MIAPVLSPTHTEEPKSRLAKAIEARGRKSSVVDVSHLGLTLPGDKAVAKIAFRVNTKGELDRAIVDAHRYVEGIAKGTDAKSDADLTSEAKLCYALWNACREVDDKGEMAVSGAFPGPRWMRDNLDNEELAALLNLYNDVEFRKSPHPFDFNDDDTERILALCADGADTEIPTAMLAGIRREIVSQYLILAAVKLRMARTRIMALEAQVAAFTEDAEPETAPDSGPGEELSQ